MTAPTTPLCIEEAFIACQRRQKLSDRPIDLLGVVSGVNLPSERLTIVHVMDRSGKARVVYYGAQQQHRIVDIIGLGYGGMSQSMIRLML